MSFPEIRGTGAPMATRNTEEAEEQTPHRAGTVAIVGRPNVGKSTLLNALLEEQLAIVSPTPQTTRHALLGILHLDNAQIGLLDTPGLHKPQTPLGKRLNSAARGAVEDADVVVFVTEPSQGIHMGVHPGDAALLGSLGKDKPTILALNKVDTVRPRSKMLPFLQVIGKVRHFESVVPIAARRNDGLDRLLKEIIALLPERPPQWGEDDLTDRPMRFFAAEFVREQILLATREEVPHQAAVSIDLYEEKKSLTRIVATIHVERDGQKAILLGKGGAQVKAIGTAARERLESFLGDRKVLLELFVRVTPEWSTNKSMLEELGFDEGKQS
jgi:GTPase